METLENYAMKILVDAGCDCYIYGGEFASKILDDLKTAFPDGMKYPYIDVANAILAISKPQPIKKSAYLVQWDNDSCSDGYGADSLEAAKESALDTLIEWMMQESMNWKYDSENQEVIPTEKEKENWDYMIFNCSVSVAEYDPNTDEYETVWEPNDEELEKIGWVSYEK